MSWQDLEIVYEQRGDFVSHGDDVACFDLLGLQENSKFFICSVILSNKKGG